MGDTANVHDLVPELIDPPASSLTAGTLHAGAPFAAPLRTGFPAGTTRVRTLLPATFVLLLYFVCNGFLFLVFSQPPKQQKNVECRHAQGAERLQGCGRRDVDGGRWQQWDRADRSHRDDPVWSA